MVLQRDISKGNQARLREIRQMSNETASTVKMTMDQWKRIHRDFKTCKIGNDKGRWVMRLTDRGTALVPVEIVKEA